jgi:hypothetical protein
LIRGDELAAPFDRSPSRWVEQNLLPFDLHKDQIIAALVGDRAPTDRLGGLSTQVQVDPQNLAAFGVVEGTLGDQIGGARQHPELPDIIARYLSDRIGERQHPGDGFRDGARVLVHLVPQEDRVVV